MKVRNAQIEKYKNAVKEYKENNANSMKQLSEIFSNYLSLYKTNNDNCNQLIIKAQSTLSELTNEKAKDMLEDTTKWSNYPKLEL